MPTLVTATTLPLHYCNNCSLTSVTFLLLLGYPSKLIPDFINYFQILIAQFEHFESGRTNQQLIHRKVCGIE
ncbi:hypothetical protein GCM10025762_23450 [Haloechinothrix salitolerans]